MILVSPGGSGKTTCAAAIIEGAVAKGRTALFVAHRTELVEQASARISHIPHGIIKAGFAPDPRHAVQVASIQTLARRALPPADIIICDEAHHAVAGQWQKFLANYPDAWVIGLSATPTRLDGSGLGSLFTSMVEIATVRELIDLGYLIPTRTLAPATPDLRGVRTVAGDFDKAVLPHVMAPITGNIVAHWMKYCRGLRTVLFASGVQHSMDLTDSLRAAGARAAHIDADTPADTRRGILADLAAGSLDVVSNCMLLGEGWDCPALGAVILARPTQSLALHIQQICRVMRPYPGQTHGLVLDHAGNTLRHGLVEDPRAWSLDMTRPKKPAPIALKVCPRCFCVFRALQAACPECGHIAPLKPRQIISAAGDLVDYVPPPLPTAGKWRELVAQGEKAGYKPGWAKIQYKNLFGVWPSRRVMG